MPSEPERLDDEYAAELRRFVASRSDLTYTAVLAEYVDQYERVADRLQDRTPPEAIQRIACSNVKSTFRTQRASE